MKWNRKETETNLWRKETCLALRWRIFFALSPAILFDDDACLEERERERMSYREVKEIHFFSNSSDFGAKKKKI